VQNPPTISARLRGAGLGAALIEYALAIVTVAAAYALTLWLWPYLRPNVAPLFLAAIMLSAWYGGLGPGVVATVLAAAASEYFLVYETGTPTSPGDLLRMLMFLGAALFISWLNGTRRAAEARLRQEQAELELHVAQRTGDLQASNDALRCEVEERQRIEQELICQQDHLRALTSELSRTEERHRRQLAARLHDDVGQVLALARIHLGPLLACACPASRNARKLGQMIDEAIANARLVTSELSPSILYELGLAPALQWLADSFAGEHGLDVEFHCEEPPSDADHETAVLLFRAVRELLVNVVKHAAARRARVQLRQEPMQVLVEVSDDGIGFARATGTSGNGASPGHFGLFNLRERLGRIGGRLEIDSAPGQGSRVMLAVPTRLLQDGQGGRHANSSAAGG
jgi:signal transduction histidine kinase